MTGERAALYVRVSGQVQADSGTSLESQEAACRAYAEERGYRVVGVYREVRSAEDLWQRPAMGRLREAIRAGEVDVAIAHDLDRFIRDQNHLGIVLDEARRHRARWEMVRQKLEDTPTGRFLLSALAFKAELERLDIIERTQRGKRGRVALGRPLHGPRPLYGYRWNEGKTAYTIYEPEALVVRRVYRELLDGLTLRRIADGLNADAYPTPAGGPDWLHALYHLLHNPAYAGRPVAYRFRRSAKGGRRPPEEWVELPPSAIPALVDWATFEAAGERLAVNRRRYTEADRRADDYLLRGARARCGYCGSTMNVRPRRERSGYLCASRRARGSECPSAWVERERVDPAVWAAFVAAAFAGDFPWEREPERPAVDTTPLDRAIAATEREVANLVRATARADDADIAARYEAEIAELTRRRRGLEAERTRLLSDRRADRRDEARSALLRDRLGREADTLLTLPLADRRRWLDALGLEVVIWGRERWELRRR
jgi:site-specific DNA recombinase